MEEIFHTIYLLLTRIDKDDLIEAIPAVRQNIVVLIQKIRNSPNLESAHLYFDLLDVLMAPLACLLFKYDYKLDPDLLEVLQNERIEDPEFRAYVYKKIKDGSLFKGMGNG